MLSLYSYLVAFFEWKISSISLAEISSILLIVFTVFKWKKICVDKSAYVLGAFLLWVLIAFFYMHDRFNFSPSSFINNYARLVFYSIGCFVIPKYVFADNFDRVLEILKKVALFLFVLGIVEFLFSLVGIDLNFYPFSDTGSMMQSSMRIKTIFSEPANFCIFISVLNLIFIKTSVHEYKREIIFCFILLLLAMSFTGYALFIFLLLVYFNEKNNANAKKFIYGVIGGILVVGLLFVALSSLDFFYERVTVRLLNIFSGADGSSIHRTLGAYEITAFGLSYSPYAGIGLGQTVSFFSTVKIVAANFFVQDGNIGINNIFAMVAIETGIVGLIILNLFVVKYFRGKLDMYLFFVLFCFSWGLFNIALFWFLLYAGRTIVDRQHELRESNTE